MTGIHILAVVGFLEVDVAAQLVHLRDEGGRNQVVAVLLKDILAQVAKIVVEGLGLTDELITFLVFLLFSKMAEVSSHFVNHLCDDFEL